MKTCLERIILRKEVTMKFTQTISRESAADWKLQVYCGMCIIPESHVNISKQENHHKSLVAFNRNICLFCFMTCLISDSKQNIEKILP